MQPDEAQDTPEQKPEESPSVDQLIVVGSDSDSPGARRKLPAAAGLVVLVALVAVGGFYTLRSPKAGISPSTVSNQTAALLPATTPPAAVTITGSGFSPSTVSVRVGQAVVWTNNDTAPHFITSDNPKPANNTPDPESVQPVSPGSSYDYVFKKAGTYAYHDNLNQTNNGFRGVVVVR